jgi:hypothetical protein
MILHNNAPALLIVKTINLVGVDYVYLFNGNLPDVLQLVNTVLHQLLELLLLLRGCFGKSTPAEGLNRIYERALEMV